MLARRVLAHPEGEVFLRMGLVVAPSAPKKESALKCDEQAHLILRKFYFFFIIFSEFARRVLVRSLNGRILTDSLIHNLLKVMSPI
jgi:hypothetical protein